MYDVTMTPFLCFVDETAWKLKRHNDVKMTSDLNFMIVFELSGQKISPYTKFHLNSSTNGWSSLFFGAKFCKVPSVILLPWQQLKI